MIALALQKALFAELGNALTEPVYDQVPHDASYPYVNFNTADTQPNDFLAERMSEVAVSLNVWSRSGGQAEVQRVIGEIYKALHKTRLPLDVGDMIEIRVTNLRTGREKDAKTYTGQVSLLALIHH